MSDVIVVGAGIIGSAIAYRLSLAKMRVVVLGAADRKPTSTTSFAWTNANAKEPKPYFTINAAGMGEHLALELELGESRFFHHTGNVECAVDDVERDALFAKVERLHAWGYPAERIDRNDVRALEPALVVPDEVEAIVFYPSEGYVDAAALATFLLDRVRQLGGDVRAGTVAKIDVAAGKVQGVVLASGDRLTADYVVCAVGRWTGALLAGTGFRLPMAPTRGILATTTRTPTTLRTMFLSSFIHLRPAGEGRVLLQDRAGDAAGDEERLPVERERLEELLLSPAQRIVRGLESAALERVDLGIRAIPGDHLSVIGWVPECEGLYAVCTHSGVTLAPFFARVAAREIASGDVEPRVAAFRPERFTAKAGDAVR